MSWGNSIHYSGLVDIISGEDSRGNGSAYVTREANAYILIVLDM